MFWRVVSGGVVVCAVVVLAGCTSGGGGSPGSSGGPVTSPVVGSGSSVSAPGSLPSRSVPVSVPRSGPLMTGPGVRAGEVPPVEDALARQHSQAGALDFAGYFVRALDWSFATTDPYLLDQVSASSCSACKRFADSLTSLQDEGGHIRGGRFTLQGLRILDGTFSIKADYVIGMRVTQSPVSVIRKTVQPSVVTSHASSDTPRLYVSWLGGGWKAVEEGGS